MEFGKAIKRRKMEQNSLVKFILETQFFGSFVCLVS